jgi:hypothetical protein
MKLLVIVIVLVILIAAALFLSANHWWVKERSATVTYGDRTSPNVSVYRSRSGDVLLNLEAHGEGLYIISYSPTTNKNFVGRPNSPNFHFFWGFALSENAPEPFVPMGGPKDEADPGLVVHPNSAEFTSHKGMRVCVSW